MLKGFGDKCDNMCRAFLSLHELREFQKMMIIGRIIININRNLNISMDGIKIEFEIVSRHELIEILFIKIS